MLALHFKRHERLAPGYSKAEMSSLQVLERVRQAVNVNKVNANHVRGK